MENIDVRIIDLAVFGNSDEEHEGEYTVFVTQDIPRALEKQAYKCLSDTLSALLMLADSHYGNGIFQVFPSIDTGPAPDLLGNRLDAIIPKKVLEPKVLARFVRALGVRTMGLNQSGDIVPNVPLYQLPGELKQETMNKLRHF